MVKMELGTSKEQSSSCKSACSSLKESITQVSSTVSEINSATELKGNAADSAKNFASSTVIPYLDKAKDYLETISVDVANLTKGYTSEVDTKSWSEEKLEAKIEEYNMRIKVNDALSAAFTGLVKEKDKKKESGIADVLQNQNDKLKECVKEYQKILDDLRNFNKSSTKYFDNIQEFSSALQSGSSCVSNGYNAQSGTFNQYSENELSWKNQGKVAKPIEKKDKHASESIDDPTLSGVLGAVESFSGVLDSAGDFFENKAKHYDKKAKKAKNNNKQLKKEVRKKSKKKKKNVTKSDIYKKNKKEFKDASKKSSKYKKGKKFFSNAAKKAKAIGGVGTFLDAYDDFQKRLKKGQPGLEAAARTGASVAVSAGAAYLPELGATLGSYIPIPVVGTAIGYGVGLAAEGWVEENINEKVVNGDIN